ncbi:MAG: formate dehydrogenase accessory sulfurtransferase FdhD [Acidimicrobiales bacterium]
MSTRRPTPIVSVPIQSFDGELRRRYDEVVGEEPLEIRLEEPSQRRSLGITMRTPGQDFDLAAGMLLTDGLIDSADDIAALRYCTDSDITEDERFNVVLVRLRGGASAQRAIVERLRPAFSACGVCGQGSLESLELRWSKVPAIALAEVGEIALMVEEMQRHQTIFTRTGGLHGAALFASSASLVSASEDIGRHNAVDKAIGRALLERRLDRATVLVVSSRCGYEIVAKAVAASISIVVSVSAPSSFAISVAEKFGIALVAFARGSRFNVYADPQGLLSSFGS